MHSGALSPAGTQDSHRVGAWCLQQCPHHRLGQGHAVGQQAQAHSLLSGQPGAASPQRAPPGGGGVGRCHRACQCGGAAGVALGCSSVPLGAVQLGALGPLDLAVLLLCLLSCGVPAGGSSRSCPSEAGLSQPSAPAPLGCWEAGERRRPVQAARIAKGPVREARLWPVCAGAPGRWGGSGAQCLKPWDPTDLLLPLCWGRNPLLSGMSRHGPRQSVIPSPLDLPSDG